MEEKEIIINSIIKLYILSILYEHESDGVYGYEIMKKMEYKNNKKLNPAQVYPFLNELEENEYIEVIERGRKDKKKYILTSKGKKFVERLFRRFEDIIYAGIKSKISVCANCGCKVYEDGVKEIIHGQELVFCCVHCKNNYVKEDAHHQHHH